MATVVPSRDFTVRSWPLMLAIVPRTRVGGAFCADAVVEASKQTTARTAPTLFTLDPVIATLLAKFSHGANGSPSSPAGLTRLSERRFFRFTSAQGDFLEV